MEALSSGTSLTQLAHQVLELKVRNWTSLLEMTAKQLEADRQCCQLLRDPANWGNLDSGFSQTIKDGRKVSFERKYEHLPM